MQTLNNLNSSAIDSLQLDKETKTALVEFKGGRKYTYTNIEDSAIESVLSNPSQSIGQWVNNNLVQNEKVDYTFGFATA